MPRRAAAQAADAGDAARVAQSREASTSRSWADELIEQLEAEEQYEALRSPSLQPPPFRQRPVAALLRSAGIDRSARKRRAWLYTERVVQPVCLLEPKMRALSDEQLRGQTRKLRARLADGATLEQLLPEAFATVRETSRRVMGLRHYDVQLIGGAAMHEGNVAEMGTGEGKTLVATLAAYLNALPQKGCVFVVTVNEYLVQRDARLMGRLYRALGLSCGCVLASMSTEERVSNAGYGADVTYVTAQELGFDYLRDTSATFPEQLRQLRPFWFAIVDEVDSILIDEARNPMLISRPNTKPVSRYVEANKVAQSLLHGVHYSVNLRERNVLLTDEGIAEAERQLDVTDLFAGSDSWAGKVTDAVTVKELYDKDTHYLVRNDEVVIVDIATGRTRKDSRWAENIHQAIEAKEGLDVRPQQQTVATITYQSFFKLFPKLSGMSGTAANEVSELFDTYGMDVVSVPPNTPLQRIDYPFTLLKSDAEKWDYVVFLVMYYHKAEIPVMVGTSSVFESEKLSEKLSRATWYDYFGAPHVGIPHNLLNARPGSVAQEAAIVAQAGRIGAVTITTNMAGRGTDILLGGNPLGLARTVLIDNLFPAFGLEVPEPLGSLGRPLELSGAVATALDSAALAARHRRKAQEGKEGAEEAAFTAPQALALLDAALERAETGELTTEDTGSVLEDTLAFAAHWVLCGCKALCEQEAKAVRQSGGLQVVGTSFHDSGRVDDQLRGRAGRQGDPGGSIFVLSLEDQMFASYKEMPAVEAGMRAVIDAGPEATQYFARFMMPAIREMQKALVNTQRLERQSTAKYDEVLHVHREVVLGLRRKVLLDTPAQRRVRFFRFFEEMIDEELATKNFNIIAPPKKWAVGNLLRLCREVTTTWSMMNPDKLQPMTNFLPGVSSEEIQVALENNLELPMGTKLPPIKAHPLSLVVLLSADMDIPVEDKSLTQSDYDDADKAAAAAAAVLKLNVERRLRDTPLSVIALSSFETHKTRLRAYLLEYLQLMYNDRVERAAHRGMPTQDFDDIGLTTSLAYIDDLWADHLSNMNVMRYSSQISMFNICDPLVEYRVQAKAQLETLLRKIRKRCITSLFQACDPVRWRSSAELAMEEGTRSYRAYLDMARKEVPDYEPEHVYSVTYMFSLFVITGSALSAFSAVYPKAEEVMQSVPLAAAATVSAAAAACAAALRAGEAAAALPPRDDARG